MRDEDNEHHQFHNSFKEYKIKKRISFKTRGAIKCLASYVFLIVRYIQIFMVTWICKCCKVNDIEDKRKGEDDNNDITLFLFAAKSRNRKNQ